MPFEKGKIPPRILVSHVTKYWRNLAFDMPLLWVDISITHFRKLDILRDIMLRSKECGLEINFHFPFIPLRAVSGTTRFRESLRIRNTFLVVAAHVVRWRCMSIIASNDILRKIMKYVTGILMPQLEHLELVQRDTYTEGSTAFAAVSCYGPLLFNPSVFSSLRLERVTILCPTPYFLSALKTLSMVHSSGCILDQEHLQSWDVSIPPIAYNPNNVSPSMTHLTHLDITGTALYGQLPCHPSFELSSLTSLKLAHFALTSIELRASIVELFSLSVRIPNLVQLKLEDLCSFAWNAFIQSLHRAVTDLDSPKYTALRSLTLSSLLLHGVDASFTKAFPDIEDLVLLNVDPKPLLEVLRGDELLWPTAVISVDGLQVTRA